MNTVKLIAYLHKEFGVPLKLMRHHDYDPYKQLCPHRMFEAKPNTWEQFKALVNAEVKGETVKPEEPTTPIIPCDYQTIFIHEFVDAWIVHKYGEVPSDNNIVNSIKPSLFGGLLYDVLEIPYKDTITIQTSDYRNVNLPLGGVPNNWYAINNAAKPNPKPQPKKETIQISEIVNEWSIHTNGQVPTNNNIVGKIRPSQFGGLTYEITGNPYDNVVTIRTRDFGLVKLPLAGVPNSWYEIV